MIAYTALLAILVVLNVMVPLPDCLSFIGPLALMLLVWAGVIALFLTAWFLLELLGCMVGMVFLTR
jgi:hypothetical protein